MQSSVGELADPPHPLLLRKWYNREKGEFHRVFQFQTQFQMCLMSLLWDRSHFTSINYLIGYICGWYQLPGKCRQHLMYVRVAINSEIN